jgi:hypothetical protein
MSSASSLEDRTPQESPSGTGQLPLSAQALHRAADGLETFETLAGLGHIPCGC